MPEVSKGHTFTANEQVTHTKLNNLVDSATLEAQAITNRSALTTIASADAFLVYDDSAAGLRKITASDLFARPVAIGGTTPAPGTFTTLTATDVVASQAPRLFARITNCSSATPTVEEQYNVASCTRNSAGNYTIALTNVVSGGSIAYFAAVEAASNSWFTPAIRSQSGGNSVTVQVHRNASGTATADDPDALHIVGWIVS